MTEINATFGDTSINATVADTTINVTIGDSVKNLSGINEDEKLVLDNDGGADSYLTYNSTLNRVELFVDGSIKAAWSA